MESSLSIGVLLPQALASHVAQLLGGGQYLLNEFQSGAEFLSFADAHKQQLDCLILQASDDLKDLACHLRQQGTLLPALILSDPNALPTSQIAQIDSPDPTSTKRSIPSASDPAPPGVPESEQVGKTDLSPEEDPVGSVLEVASSLKPQQIYHAAELYISQEQLDTIEGYIDQAIQKFLELSAILRATTLGETNRPVRNFLLQKQRRLSEKLKERLGYLGVYYKRNSSNFLRNLTWAEKQELIATLKEEYRSIVLNYFSDDALINEMIDQFVSTAFFSDVPVTQIVEIHMQLMDAFSKQLKLEGRNEDILLDYRLTLIDVIAHLCEMYRRSVPREAWLLKELRSCIDPILNL